MAAANDHIDLAAHAEFRQIDSWLNRETGIGQDASLVVDFKIVHVGAVGVDLRSDGVAGTMDEVVSEARPLDMAAGCTIHLPAGNIFAGSDCFLYETSF